MALGLFLAVIVNQKIRGQTFFRAAFYFPAIASSAAITVLWIFLFQSEGLFNDVRGLLGLNPLFQLLGIGPNHNWIGTSNTALNTIIAPRRAFSSEADWERFADFAVTSYERTLGQLNASNT